MAYIEAFQIKMFLPKNTLLLKDTHHLALLVIDQEISSYGAQ